MVPHKPLLFYVFSLSPVPPKLRKAMGGKKGVELNTFLCRVRTPKC